MVFQNQITKKYVKKSILRKLKNTLLTKPCILCTDIHKALDLISQYEIKKSSFRKEL